MYDWLAPLSHSREVTWCLWVLQFLPQSKNMLYVISKLLLGVSVRVIDVCVPLYGLVTCISFSHHVCWRWHPHTTDR